MPPSSVVCLRVSARPGRQRQAMSPPDIGKIVWCPPITCIYPYIIGIPMTDINLLSPKRRLCVVTIVTCVLVILLLLVIMYPEIESIMGIGHDRRLYRTQRAMFAFSRAVEIYYIVSNSHPGADLESISKSIGQPSESLSELPTYMQWVKECQMVRTGKDAWGNDFILRWSPNHCVGTIISKGTNGKYDNGQGDDICLRFELIQTSNKAYGSSSRPEGE